MRKRENSQILFIYRYNACFFSYLHENNLEGGEKNAYNDMGLPGMPNPKPRRSKTTRGLV